MPSAYARQIPEATLLEKAGPKGYIRLMFPMELPDKYDMEECFAILQAGFQATQERIPSLKCEGVLDTEAKQAGVLRLQEAHDLEALVCRDLRAPGAFSLSFSEMKSKGFPVAAFPGDLLWRRFTWPTPGERLPVIAVQANFVPGGLLLALCGYHVFSDANTYYTWLETWAEECRRAQGIEHGPRVDIPDVVFTDRERVMTPSGRNAGRAEDHDEYMVLPFTPEGMPEKMLSRAHAGQVFAFSAESLARLKADAAPAHATQPTDVPWVSTTDALTALMWRSVLAAQIAPEELRAADACPQDGAAEGDPLSIASLAADARLGRTDPPVHPRTLGNWLCWRQAAFPVRAMLASASLADLACAVRQATVKLDRQWADDLIAMFDGLEDVNRAVPTAFLDVPGKCFVQTTWSQLTVCDLAWGPKLGDRIRAVRSPDIGIINGGSVVLPPLPGGGIECILGVEAKGLPRLLSDPLLAKYATPITL